MRQTLNDLPESSRAVLVPLLNARLADAIDLSLQAKQAHWNVRGPHFAGLHALFDQVAASADEYADLIAERAVALGGLAEGTLQVVGQRTQLAHYPTTSVQWEAHAERVCGALATFVARSDLRSRRARRATTPPRRTCSPRCRAGSTSCSGWSKCTSVADVKAPHPSCGQTGSRATREKTGSPRKDAAEARSCSL
jgi:starvation-inducible DNA-binding protein